MNSKLYDLIDRPGGEAEVTSAKKDLMLPDWEARINVIEWIKGLEVANKEA